MLKVPIAPPCGASGTQPCLLVSFVKLVKKLVSFFRAAACHRHEYSKRKNFFPLFPTAVLHLIFFCNTFRRLRAFTSVCCIPPTNSLLTTCQRQHAWLGGPSRLRLGLTPFHPYLKIKEDKNSSVGYSYT